MPKQDTLKLEFTVEETNTIIESLGHMPFMRVYRIIEKIHLQASSQQNNTAALLGGLPPKKKKKRK